CGNPPVERNQETITTKNRSDSHSSGHFSVHFPSNRGIATPACALVRNDRKLEAKLLNNNLPFSLRYCFEYTSFLIALFE
ncbi:MAG: hypothetical protein ACI4PL_01795, partial [Faecousia sp.]